MESETRVLGGEKLWSIAEMMNINIVRRWQILTMIPAFGRGRAKTPPEPLRVCSGHGKTETFGGPCGKQLSIVRTQFSQLLPGGKGSSIGDGGEGSEAQSNDGKEGWHLGDQTSIFS